MVIPLAPPTQVKNLTSAGQGAERRVAAAAAAANVKPSLIAVSFLL
jgi:hypothetical protein